MKRPLVLKFYQNNSRIISIYVHISLPPLKAAWSFPFSFFYLLLFWTLAISTEVALLHFEFAFCILSAGNHIYQVFYKPIISPEFIPGLKEALKRRKSDGMTQVKVTELEVEKLVIYSSGIENEFSSLFRHFSLEFCSCHTIQVKFFLAFINTPFLAT